MTTYIQILVQKHARSGILLDANILLLLVVGSYDRNQIAKFKRTQVFAIEDYDTLINFISQFDQIITTPNIITEVSNLLGQLTDLVKMQIFELFGRSIAIFKEQYIPSKEVADHKEFHRFGVTDAAIVSISQRMHLILTDDFRLSQYLQSKGADVINFNHIRTLNWN